MKNKLVISGIILVLAVLIWSLYRQEPSSKAAPTKTNTPPPVVNDVDQTPSNAAPTPFNVDKNSPEQMAEMHAEIEKRRQAMAEKVHNEWKTPIEFYGLVEDESNNIVVGAAVEFSCNDDSTAGTSYYHGQSDVNGLFSIQDIQGKLLEVSVSKQGYYSYDSPGKFFYYAGENQNFVPDAGNPVVFRLRKKGTAEKLIHIAGIGLHVMRDFLLTTNGKPVDVSLSNGKAAPDGQGDLQIEYISQLPEAPSRKFYWKYRISSPGGGILQTDEQFPFLAPENGYFDFDEIVKDPKSDNQWGSAMGRQYYIKLRNGRYARVKVQIRASNSQPYFRMESFLNPSGSRNLEFDPSVGVTNP